MTPEEMLAAVKAIAEGLRSDLTESITKLDEKHTAAIADAVKKFDAKKKDAAGEDDMRSGEDDMTTQGNMARRTAADSIGAAEFSVLRREVADLQKKVARPMADLNAFAAEQSKADAVMRTHNLSAEPPMAGEDIVSYKIRQARAMQKWSPKWKGVELRAIAADSVALEHILTEIRADAVQASNNPVGLALGQFREVTSTAPGGHLIKSFIGSTETTGTIFKQLSRPVRQVAYIGPRTGVSSF